MFSEYFSFKKILFTYLSLLIADNNVIQANTNIMIGYNEMLDVEQYITYRSVSIIHFKVPQDVEVISFIFQANVIKVSSFVLQSCPAHNVSVYLKHGSLPVISPDNGRFPETFFNLSARTDDIIHKDFLANNDRNYINISRPAAGDWFGITFRPWVPKDQQKIALKDLSGGCKCVLTSYAFVNLTSVIYIDTDASKEYKFVGNLVLKLDGSNELSKNFIVSFEILNCSSNCLVNVFRKDTIPSNSDYIDKVRLTSKKKLNFFLINLEAMPIQYFLFKSNSTEQITILSRVNSMDNGDFNDTNDILQSNVTNSDQLISKCFHYSTFDQAKYIVYNKYNLIKLSTRKTLSFSFMVTPNVDLKSPKMINLTEKYTVLKFDINSVNEIGGTLYFGLTLNPLRDVKNGYQYKVVTCLRRLDFEIPTLAGKCVHLNGVSQSPFSLDSSSDVGTFENIYIPYPEIGSWYITIGVFDVNENPCKDFYEICSDFCERNCNCISHMKNLKCANETMNEIDLNLINKTLDSTDRYFDVLSLREINELNVSVIFSVASSACMDEECGKQGDCRIMVDNGILFSTCICAYEYKGWICTDNSDIDSKVQVLCECLLLTLSNVAFIGTVFIAVRHYYYAEATVYFFICIFSTMYHMCDAGEGIYTVCIMSLPLLKFCDFYCGLLAIWVTLVAMANLAWPTKSVCQMTGAILLALGTVYNMEGLLVFIIPFTIGSCIFLLSWTITCKKTLHVYPGGKYLKIYFPLGTLILVIGIVFYAFLETRNNYPYIHSLWHICMAVCAALLLPNPSVLLKDGQYIK